MNLIVQPYSGQLGKYLTEDLNSGKYNSFSFSVAYAKISGVDALYDSILAFKTAGGTIRATIGIDQKNTSFEAVKAVLSFAEEVFIFHNHQYSSTFHPKVYIFSGERCGKIYIGSNNLTNGGLYSNYEVTSYEEFDLSIPASSESFMNMVHSLHGFRQTGPCCKLASDELIRKLYEGHMLCSENEIQIISRRSGGARVGRQEGSIFGIETVSANTKKHDFSYLSPEIRIRKEYQVIPASENSDAPSVEDIEGTDEPVQSFYKHLSKNDVDLQSSPGQIIIPIAFKSFFEPLSEPQITRVGAMQSERYFNIQYENNGEIVENARVIFYVPSPQAPRRNSEVRFALRNRAIFGTFEQGDILVFSQAPRNMHGQYLFTIKKVSHDSPDADAFPSRFAWIIK